MRPAMFRLIHYALAPGQRRLWRALLIALVIAVTWLALMPTPPKAMSTGWDKSNHLLAFGSLAFASVWAHWQQPRQWWRLVAALLGYGVAIEIAQHFLPPRDADATDVLADALGIGLGLLLAWPFTVLAARRG